MNKEQYLSALEHELMILPLEERLSALQYYKDYFDDAGLENEAKVIADLGSPKKVASDILNEYKELSTEVNSENKETSQFEQQPNIKKPIGLGKGFLLVLLGLLIIPIGIPLFFAIFGLIISFVAVFFSLFLCLLLLSVVFFLSGVALTVKGIFTLFISPIESMFTVGVGLSLTGLGLLLGIAFIKICKSVLPSMLRWFVDICRRPFNRRKGANI